MNRDRFRRSRGWVKVLPWYYAKARMGSRADAKRAAIKRDRADG